jgi:hypothetical protein
MSQHKQLIEARFPHLEHMFYFYNDKIIGIRKGFEFAQIDCYRWRDFVFYISTSERNHIESFTDYEEFVNTVHSAKVW